MRRSIAAVATLAAALSLTAVGASSVSGAAAATGSSTNAADAAQARAEQALRTADRILDDVATPTTTPDTPTPGPADPDASMALLRLRLTMGALSPADRERARTILARPTDHPDPADADELGAYRAPAKRKCAGHICIHWVDTTSDRAPSHAWVNTMLAMMNQVWRYEIGTLGYRAPIGDGNRGGGGANRFDVYLKDIGSARYYGITLAERPTSYNRHLWSSYIVLDNDFARSQFGAKPIDSARVTAAHEFFHAIQYAYDTGEDAWLMETTATWMEDQFADGINDNRQYLPWSQLKKPGTPLDTYSTSGAEQYGNWVFFEYLSEHYGRAIVRSIWKQAAVFGSGGHRYSAQAIRKALARHGGMQKVFGSYASANTRPGVYYSEGRAYPAARAVQTVTLTRATRVQPAQTRRVNHLASVNLKAKPGSDLAGRSWRLRVQVDGPARSNGPAVVVMVTTRHGGTTRHLMRLDRAGKGHVAVPFSARRISAVTVTLANASTRFTRCGQGRYSCSGVPVVAQAPFHVRLTAFSR